MTGKELWKHLREMSENMTEIFGIEDAEDIVDVSETLQFEEAERCWREWSSSNLRYSVGDIVDTVYGIAEIYMTSNGENPYPAIIIAPKNDTMNFGDTISLSEENITELISHIDVRRNDDEV